MNDEDDRLTREELAAFGDPKALPALVEDATVARLRARGILRVPGRMWVVRPSRAILAVCGSFLLGLVTVTFLRSAHLTMDSRPEFLLLLYGGPRAEDTKLVGAGHAEEYSLWARDLAARGHLLLAGELTRETQTLGPSGEPRRGTAAAEEPVGYFVFRASDRLEARRLSETCPHLRYGGRLELRRIADRGGS
jgi:hypothetical protein